MSNNLTYIPYYQPLSSPSVSFQQSQLGGGNSHGFSKSLAPVSGSTQQNQTVVTTTGVYPNSSGICYNNISTIPNSQSFNQMTGTFVQNQGINFLKSPIIIAQNGSLSNSTMSGNVQMDLHAQAAMSASTQNQMFQSRHPRSPIKQGSGILPIPSLRSSSSKRSNEVAIDKQFEMRALFSKTILGQQTNFNFDKPTNIISSFQLPSQLSNNHTTTINGGGSNNPTPVDTFGIEVINRNGVFEVKCDSIYKQSEEVLNSLKNKEVNVQNIKQTIVAVKELETKYLQLHNILNTQYQKYLLGSDVQVPKTATGAQFNKQSSTVDTKINMPSITITPLDNDNKILKISKIPDNLTFIEKYDNKMNMPHSTSHASSQNQIQNQKRIPIINSENNDITIVLSEIKGNTNIQTYGNNEKIFKTETDDDPSEQYSKEEIKQRFLAINDEDNSHHLLSIPGEIKKKPSNSPKKMSFDVSDNKDYKSSDEIERILQQFKNSGMSKSVNHEAISQKEQSDDLANNNNDKNEQNEQKKKNTRVNSISYTNLENTPIDQNDQEQEKKSTNSNPNMGNTKRKLSDILESSKDNTAQKVNQNSNAGNDKSPSSSKNSKKNPTQELMDRVNNVLQRSDLFLMKHSDKKLKKGSSKNYTNNTADEVLLEKNQEYDQSSEIRAIMDQVKRKIDLPAEDSINMNDVRSPSNIKQNLNIQFQQNSPSSNKLNSQNKSQTSYIPSINLQDNLRKSSEKTPQSNQAVHGSGSNTGTNSTQGQSKVDSPSSIPSYQPISHEGGYGIKSTFSKMVINQANIPQYGSFAYSSPKMEFNSDNNKQNKGSNSMNTSPRDFKQNNLQNLSRQADEIIGDISHQGQKSFNSSNVQSPYLLHSYAASPSPNINLKDSISSKPSEKIDSAVGSQKNSAVIKYQKSGSQSHVSDQSELEKVTSSPKAFTTNNNILSQITPQAEQSSKQVLTQSNQASEAKKDLNSFARNIGQSGVFSPQSYSSNKSIAFQVIANQTEIANNDNCEVPSINPFMKECTSQENDEPTTAIVSLKQLRCSQSMYAPLYKVADPFNYSITNFEVGKKLGHGKFADVYAAVDKQTGFRVALKQIKKETIKEFNLYQDILNEIKVQKILDHPNIIKLYGFFIDNDSIYLIQELACGKELFTELKSTPYKKFTESIASFYVRQVIEALIYMHSKNVVHRDLKPENIMVFNGLLKICDFGYAARVEKNKMRNTFCGTLDYVSPEMVQGKSYDFSVDVWSVGILTYELLIGYAPFAGKNHDATFDQIVNGELRFSNPVSFEGGDFISKILERDPNSRMNLAQALQHPFIQNEYVKRLQNEKGGEIDFSDFNKM